MDAGSYVGVSAHLALERRLAVIANNVANAGTAGYRAEGTAFATIVSKTTPYRTAFAAEHASHVDTRSGGFVETRNPLDIAIQGDGFLGLQTPAGIAYTRDGRMQMLPTGDLVSLSGHAILDAGGAPLTIDPNSGPPAFGRDGTIFQQGLPVGAIGLFALDLSKPAQRYENAAFIPDKPPEPITDFAGNGIVQGFTEESNVNAISEMTRLIEVSRAFEAVATGLDRRDSMLREAVQTLGGRT